MTDAEFVILSLIYEQPLHGYQIEKEITRRNMRTWTDLSTSSIYYILKRLENKGFIEKLAAADSQAGVPRREFNVTAEGRKAWKAATLHALSQPRITYTNFLMGLHNLAAIPPAEALAAVKQYRQWLEEDLQRQKNELDQLGVSFFPLDVLFDYGFVLGEAELAFLTHLISRLEKMVEES